MPSFPLFSSSITAMRAQSNAFAAIGDNIANTETEGYKASDVRFASIVAGKNGGSTIETLAGARPKSQAFIEKTARSSRVTWRSIQPLLDRGSSSRTRRRTRTNFQPGHWN